MEVKLVAYGIARDILGASEILMELNDRASIAGLKAEILSKYPEFEKLKSLKFAVNEDYQKDDYTLQSRDEVVIIPPVSGG